MKKINCPHDRFFKIAMTHQRVAKNFFAQHLPGFIYQIIDLNTLQLEKDSFITPQLRLFMSDLLFSADFSGKPGYLYLLLEHRSTPSRWQPFTMLQYIMQIMDGHLKKLEESKMINEGRLPLVYPIVLYNGETTYPYSTDLFDLFDQPAELVQKIWLQPFQLVDVGVIPDENLKKEVWSSIMQMVMKHVYDRDVLSHIRGLGKALQEVYDNQGEDYIEAVFNYLFATTNVEDPATFARMIQEVLPLPLQERNMRMTAAEYYESQGLQKGMEQGIQTGARDKAKTIAIKLLQENRPPQEVAQITDLPLKVINALKEKEKIEE